MNLLFDLDGTLADPSEAFVSGMEYALAELRLPALSREILHSMIGPPLQTELLRVLPAELRPLAPQILQTYRKHHGEIGIYLYRFYAGMDEAMKSLRAEHTLYVATSKPKVYADEIFRHFGKSHYFKVIYGSELSGENSKKGDLIRFAMREQSLRPEDTLMIGDRKHDLIGAAENGVRAIGVTWGFGDAQELRGANATAVVSDWTGLLAGIRSLGQP